MNKLRVKELANKWFKVTRAFNGFIYEDSEGYRMVFPCRKKLFEFLEWLFPEEEV